MKRIILILSILTFFATNSCKDKKGVVDPINPGTVDPRSSVELPEGFKMYTMTDPNTNAGVYIENTDKSEYIVGYGSKSADGNLTSLESIIINNTKNRVALTISVGSDELVSKVEFLSEIGKSILTLTNYNLSNKTVDGELIGPNKQVLFAKRELPLSADVIEFIDFLKKRKGGRLQGQECHWKWMTAIWTGWVSCYVMTTINLSPICKAVSVGGLAMTLRCITVTQIFQYTVCSPYKKLYEKLSLECQSNNEPIPPLPFPNSSCVFSSMSSASSIRDYYDKVIECSSPPSRTGYGWGDPHLTTTDGLYYDFHGFGEFIILKSTTDNFEVQGRFEAFLNREYASMTTALGIQTGDDVVSVHCNPMALFVNDVKQTISSGTISLKSGASITVEGKNVKVINSSNERVEIDAYGVYLNYSIFLSQNRKGKVEGLLGNFDGNKENDLRTKEGELVKNEFSSLYPQFSDSWRVSKNFLLHYESGKNTESYTRRDLPKPIPSYSEIQRGAARNACMEAGVTTEPYLSNCIFDLLVTDNRDFIKGYVDLVEKKPFDPSAPSNDEYAGAITIPINNGNGYNCANTVFGTTSGATFSPLASCSNQRKDDDVWFKFTATAAIHVLRVSDIKAVNGTNNYRNVQVYQAVNNAPGENILCAEMTLEEKFLTGLKVGSTYFVRVSSWSENVRLNFKLCISTPPVPPVNDEYSGAIGLTMNADLECKSTTSGTTNGATASPLATCSNQRKDDDVWFKFTATAATHMLKLSEIKAVNGPNSYRNVQVYQAVNNAPSENILCAEMTFGEKSLTGLKVGSTYFVRVSSWTENVRLDFKLCVSTN